MLRTVFSIVAHSSATAEHRKARFECRADAVDPRIYRPSLRLKPFGEELASLFLFELQFWIIPNLVTISTYSGEIFLQTHLQI